MKAREHKINRYKKPSALVLRNWRKDSIFAERV